MNEALHLARGLMGKALDVLDAAGAPADIGAHLDLALCRVSKLVAAPERQISGESETELR